MRSRPYVPYVVFVAMLWGLVLPGVLVVDAGDGVPWRDAGPLLMGAFLAAAGLTLITTGSRHLASAGIGLFGVRPGPRLVTDGPYGLVRNPIDVGTTLLAIGIWLAVDVALLWVIPAAAVVSFVAGVGPYEDRLLLEEFETEFEAYRARVTKWVPRRR